MAQGAEVRVLGIGIDLEIRDALSRHGAAALARASDRWLAPAERAWCRTQGCLPEALTVLLSCKEAVYKAWPGSGGVHRVVIEGLEGSVAQGSGRAAGAPLVVTVRWQRWRDQTVAVAVAVAPLSVSRVPPPPRRVVPGAAAGAGRPPRR